MVVEQYHLQQNTVGKLTYQLINNLNYLLRQHIELFRMEISEDAQKAAKYASIAIIGTLIAYTSLIFFGFFLIFAMSGVMPLWLSSFIVTLIYFVIAGISLITAKNHLKKLKGPETTIGEAKKTAEESKKWLHELK